MKGGLPALGCAYGGDYAAVLGPYAVAAEPAMKRLEQASALAEECAKYREDARPEATWQASWHLLRSVVARALVYDVRTLEPATSIPLAERLDREVRGAARRILGVNATDGWTEDTDMQMAWPVDLGGMGFGSAALAARVGRLAAVAQCLPTARAHLQMVLPEASQEEILEAIGLEGVCDTLQWLREEHNIEIAAGGEIATGSEPRFDPRAHFEPIRGLQGRLTRAIFQGQKEALLARHEEAEKQERARAAALRRRKPGDAKSALRRALAHLRTRVRLRSAAGGIAGTWAETCPKRPELRLNDDEFAFAARWRLGLRVMMAGECGHRNVHAKPGPSSGPRGRCGQFLDEFGDHAALCGKGRGRYRRHNAVAHCLSRIAREAGIETGSEEVCPALLKGTPSAEDAVEARLDVHLWSGGQGWIWEEG